MGFLFGTLYFLLNSLLYTSIIFDTIGLLYQLKNYNEKVDKKDHQRVVYTWVILLTLNALTPCCKSRIGSVITLFLLVVKLAVVFPVSGVASLLISKFVETKKIEG